MNSNNTKSSKELQSDVRSEINQIKQSLDNIKNRISPGQLIDDAIFYPHKGDPAMTFDHLKRNPIGSTFLAIGTMLLMEDDQHRSYESTVTQKVGEAASISRAKMSSAVHEAKGKVGDMKQSLHTATDNARTKVTDLTGAAKAKVSQLKGAAKSKVNELKGSDDTVSTDQDWTIAEGTQEHMLSQDGGYTDTTTFSDGSDSEGNLIGNVKDSVSSTFNDLSTSASELTGSVKENVSSTVDSVSGTVREKMSDVSASASSMSSRVKESVSSTYVAAKDRVRSLDPIAYIAIGAGLGAISGASLPVSQIEHRLLDDKLSDGLSAFKAEFQTALSQSFDLMKSEFVSELTSFDLNKLKSTFGHSASKSV